MYHLFSFYYNLMYKSTKKNLILILLYIPSCMFSIWDLHGPSFILVSCYSAQHAVNPLEFFFLGFSGFRTDLVLLNFCPFPILVGLQSSSPPIPPYSAVPGGSPSRVKAYLPLVNCLRGEGLGQHACSGWYTCALKSRVIRRGNTWLEAVCWLYPMWVLPSKIIMLLFKINSK